MGASDLSCVTVSQKPAVERMAEKLNEQQLHAQMLDVRDKDRELEKTMKEYRERYTVPMCIEIQKRFKRYKKDKVPRADRLNAQPTAEAYFQSIGMNYATVRQWIKRARHGEPPKRKNLRGAREMKLSHETARCVGYMHAAKQRADELRLPEISKLLPDYKVLDEWIERERIPYRAEVGDVIEAEGQEYRIAAIDLATLTIRLQAMDMQPTLGPKKEPQSAAADSPAPRA